MPADANIGGIHYRPPVNRSSSLPAPPRTSTTSPQYRPPPPPPSRGFSGAIGRIAQAVSPRGVAQTRAQQVAAQAARARSPIFGGSANGQFNRIVANRNLQFIRQQIATAQKMPGVAQSNRNILSTLAAYEPAYQRMAAQLWGRASGFYPKGAKEPPMGFTPPVQNYGLGKGGRDLTGELTLGVHPFAAVTQNGRVTATPDTAVGAFQGDSAGAYDKQVPLHEWVHAFQAPSLLAGYRSPRGRALVEGGAEALKQRIAKALGMPYEPAVPYQAYVNFVRQLGDRYLTQGQFAAPPPP